MLHILKKKEKKIFLIFCQFIILLYISIYFTSCIEFDTNNTEIFSNFESGSIGKIEQINNHEWTISLRNDNGDNSLPKTWRCWWYIRIDNVSINAPLKINLRNRGWPYYYVPVYSYDNKNWIRFSEEEVSQPSDYELKINKKFENNRVWLARFYPYTFSQLNSYLETINNSPRIFTKVIGQTTYGNPIIMVTITDFSIGENKKKRVWIHARTHPAETGSSYLLEGLINFLVSNKPDAERALSRLIFHIIPMQNVDGVVEGNYRTTPDTQNLEIMWYPDNSTPDPFDLREDVPPEIQSLNRVIRDLMDTEAPFTMALNLHSSNSEPDTAAFFYPHFGAESLGYSKSEAALWESQLSFIKYVATYYNNRIEPIPSRGGSSFARKYYPESWWWRNFQHNVMAITMETVYGRGGFAPSWITPKELRELGHAVGLAIMAYHNIPVKHHIRTLPRLLNRGTLKYPDLYPPAAEDELKE